MGAIVKIPEKANKDVSVRKTNAVKKPGPNIPVWTKASVKSVFL